MYVFLRDRPNMAYSDQSCKVGSGRKLLSNQDVIRLQLVPVETGLIRVNGSYPSLLPLDPPSRPSSAGSRSREGHTKTRLNQITSINFKSNQIKVNSMADKERATITAYVDVALKRRLKQFLEEFSRDHFNLKETQASEIAIRRFLDQYYPPVEGQKDKFRIQNAEQLQLDFSRKQ